MPKLSFLVPGSPRVNFLVTALFIVVAAITIVFPDKAKATIAFVAISLLQVLPLVVPGILIAAWVSASNAGGQIADVFNGNLPKTIVAASLIGSITPVCGITVLPLMAGLLAAGVPLAPVMAFWLSSPVTDPAMLAATAATLGVNFAFGKTLSAFGLGLFGGSVTAVLAKFTLSKPALRDNALVGSLGKTCGSGEIAWAIWRSPERRKNFLTEATAISRLVVVCLVPAFAAEFVLQSLLDPESLTHYVGGDVWWAIPLAVVVGAPAYLDGFAALPLTRSLMDHGMSSGAAMAFLVSGGVVSIWGAMAIFPVLKLKPFLLYLILAITGSMVSGWVFGMTG